MLVHGNMNRPKARLTGDRTIECTGFIIASKLKAHCDYTTLTESHNSQSEAFSA